MWTTLGKLILLVLLVAFVGADDYRLGLDVLPSNYDVELTLNEEFGKTGIFSGVVKMIITPQKNTNQFELHVDTLTINDIILIEPDRPPKIIQTNRTINATLNKLIISTTTTLRKDNPYTLTIMYDGKLFDDMRGFYRSSYKNEMGKDVWIATTQFQPTHARRAFPCFDEPNFKATFDIKIIRPRNCHALANTPLKETVAINDTLEKDTFMKTPKMSTYLVAFIVSDFVKVGDNTYGVWSRQGAIQTAFYGYHIGTKLIKQFEKLYNSTYMSTNIGKLDQVAIPDFSAGAMENWGLITYRETALLWDPLESTNSNKQRVATVVAHELAHMWFGNLVTMNWWSHTWLNEGFARYFQYFATHLVETDWELDKQFIVEQQQAIFAPDALSSALPLSSDVSSPAEISNKFALISYNKGACVIRMMEHFIGSENFKSGLRQYLKTNEYKNTVPLNLWAALKSYTNETQLPANLTTVMDNWIFKAGYPVVTVSMSGNDAILSQKRFLLSSSAQSSTEWYIPITYTSSREPVFEKTSPSAWLSPRSNLTIPSIRSGPSGWVIVNVKQSGYYRVNYDETLWSGLTQILESAKYNEIDVLNRAQIVDDALNLARAGINKYSRALDVTNYLAQETEYYPWYAAFNGFSFLRRRIGSNNILGNQLDDHIRKLMMNLYKNVSFATNYNDRHIEVLKKVTTLTWACALDVEDCIQNTRTLFDEYKNNKTVNPNLRSTVYCTALRNSASSDNWDFLWNKFLTTDLATEQAILISSLGCSKNTTLLRRYLEKSIDPNSGIRSQDAQSVFTSVISNPEGLQVAIEFLINNYAAISNNYGGMNALSGVITGLADRLTTKEQVDIFEKFVNDHIDDLKEAANVAKSAVENAKANLEWTKSSTEQIKTWLERKTSSAFTAKSSATAIVTLVLLLFTFY